MITKEHAPVRRVVRAFPVLRGKEADLDLFVREVSERVAELAPFYSQFGITHESWYRQDTPSGLLVIVVTEIMRTPVSSVAQQYQATERPFDRWFKDRVRDLSGIDPDSTPLGPPSENIFSWPE